MEIGKLPNEVLKAIVFDKIRNNRKEVLVRPGVGEDCAAVDFDQEICVISSDPITGTDSEIGVLAVHVSCNDIASAGAEPIGIMVTVLVPPDATMSNLERIMQQLADTAAAANVDIIGGHTEVTDAVTRFVISVTAIGKSINKAVVKTSGAKPGDSLIITKYAGLEGTSILAFDHQKELERVFGRDLVEKAQKLVNQISVVKEGFIASKHGVHAMHDITEGGVLGAVWEMCDASGCGAEITEEEIPVLEETKRICSYFKIDPLKLISSGSMLIAADSESAPDLVKKLQSEGINAAIIGKTAGNNTRILYSGTNGIMISPPESDELYKVRKNTMED